MNARCKNEVFGSDVLYEMECGIDIGLRERTLDRYLYECEQTARFVSVPLHDSWVLEKFPAWSRVV